jgi:hypothetical protein
MTRYVTGCEIPSAYLNGSYSPLCVGYREFSARLYMPASDCFAYFLEAEWHNLRVLRALLLYMPRIIIISRVDMTWTIVMLLLHTGAYKLGLWLRIRVEIVGDVPFPSHI